MPHSNDTLARILRALDLGSSVAEQDTLLENARVETSVFTDLLEDRVDLIPGTKGSGKSALYRIFVDFLPEMLLERKKVILAHGVQRAGDEIFHAFSDEFETMTEEDFLDFWCVYLISLAHEHFVKRPRYSRYLQGCDEELSNFRNACQLARIPEFEKPRNLRGVLEWAIAVVRSFRPIVRYTFPDNGGTLELDMFGKPVTTEDTSRTDQISAVLPRHVGGIRDTLESVLRKADLNLWLMIDRLDEIFPRRSAVETRALRALLRTLRIFESKQIRVKVFLRDDILEQIVAEGNGFTALTHVTARQADTLKWSENQILTMIVKRLFACRDLASYLSVETARLEANQAYREELFYRVFPKTVHRGFRKCTSMSLIYTHTQDGKGVVTPRDVIDLLTKAKQRQQDDFNANPSGTSAEIIGAAAIRYGLKELSKRKRETYLEAEFPHLWTFIKKFVKGKAEYTASAMGAILGTNWQSVVDDLVSVGVLSLEVKRNGSKSYTIPFVYRDGLEVTQGKMK